MATNMKPRVTRRERKLLLSYELPHRIHSAHIYPFPAPNGSTVIIYGYDSGLRILWRGGRRRKTTATASASAIPPPADHNRQTDIIVLDDDDDYEETDQRRTEADGEFEAEEAEMDADCPYPSIIQDLDLPTGSDVLHIAVPALHATAVVPQLLRKVAVVAISSADGALRLLQIPLTPPVDEFKGDMVKEIVHSQIELAANAPVPIALATKFVPIDAQTPIVQRRQNENVQGQLLVASTTRALSIWSVSVTAEALVPEDQKLVQKTSLLSPASHLAFHPSPRSTQVLLTDHTGTARIYDPYALKTSQKRPGSSDSTLEIPTRPAEPGKWVIGFHTSYPIQKDASIDPIVARRTKILDAKWILAGNGILALLEDGQWGIWDPTASTRSGNGTEDFVVSGFLDSASSSKLAEPIVPKKGASRLAPMTPNTRKSKAEQVFTGASKAPGAKSKGGISVASNYLRTGQADESVALWYDSAIYSITNMQTFWRNSTTSGGGIGSLYAPGLAHMTEINLCNEDITSISQFSAKSSSADIGHMNTQRDLLISAEHRAIIWQSLRPPTPARTLFQVAERPASRDHPMLDIAAGGLMDIDRQLDDMAVAGNNPRRVGFAH